TAPERRRFSPTSFPPHGARLKPDGVRWPRARSFPPRYYAPRAAQATRLATSTFALPEWARHAVVPGVGLSAWRGRFARGHFARHLGHGSARAALPDAAAQAAAVVSSRRRVRLHRAPDCAAAHGAARAAGRGGEPARLERQPRRRAGCARSP